MAPFPSPSEANSPIPVADLTVTALDGKPVRMPVRAVLRLLPRPLLVMEYDDFPATLIDNSVDRRELQFEGGGNVEVLNPRPLPGPKGLRGSLIPVQQPFTLFDKKRPLQAVSFRIVNFLDLHGQHDEFVEVDGHSRLCGTALLVAGPFQVTIRAMQDLPANRRILAEVGGYAATHWGCLERLDGGQFSVAEAEQVLSALRSFLSFARGTSCALASVDGTAADGERSWIRWGSHGVAGWNVASPWVWNLAGGMDVLADVFPGFWTSFQTDAAKSDQALELAMHWYLCSNETDAITASLLLSQAALERLTFKEVGPKPKGERTGCWIDRALGRAGIGQGIPTQCQHLAAASQRHNWTSGPHAITVARNDLVHPDMKRPVATEVLIDVWNLSQWYVELLLLSRFGYGGSYRNRLTDGWEPVPWAY